MLQCLAINLYIYTQARTRTIAPGLKTLDESSPKCLKNTAIRLSPSTSDVFGVYLEQGIDLTTLPNERGYI